MLIQRVAVQVINHAPIRRVVTNHALHQDAVVHHTNLVQTLRVAQHILDHAEILVVLIKA